MSDALKYAMDDTDGISASLDMDLSIRPMRRAWARRCEAAVTIASTFRMEMLADTRRWCAGGCGDQSGD